jgi:hypothetical protein
MESNSPFKIEHGFRNSHASVIVWNFKHKINGLPNSAPTSDGSAEECFLKDDKFKPDEVNKRIISANSIISISTSKSKTASPGGFEIKLAPTKNWLKLLTNGSWVAILMSNKALMQEDFDKASAESLRFVGRIDSVRLAIGNMNGVPSTEYIVTGTDWSSIFNVPIYIDRAVFVNNADTLTLTKRFLSIAEKEGYRLDRNSYPYYSTNNMCNFIFAFLSGKAYETIKPSKEEQADNALSQDAMNVWKLIQSLYQDVKVSIPNEVSAYLGMDTSDTTAFSKVSRFYGILNGNTSNDPIKDTENHNYDSTDDCSISIFTNDFWHGLKTPWEMFSTLANLQINEVFAELVWNEKVPKFGFFKRIKPFFINDKDHAMYKKVEGLNANIISNYKDLSHVYVPREAVLNIDVGFDNENRFNFIEVQPYTSVSSAETYSKISQRLMQEDAFKREGVKAGNFTFYGSIRKKGEKDGLISPIDTKNFKFLFAEWYFNNHLYFNGTLAIKGIDKPIVVGHNIVFDFNIFGFKEDTFIKSTKDSTYKGPFYCLAHVETVSHSFTVTDTGVRMYHTSIHFTKGIIIDSTYKFVKDEDRQVVSCIDLEAQDIETSTTDVDNVYFKNQQALINDKQKVIQTGRITETTPPKV